MTIQSSHDAKAGTASAPVPELELERYLRPDMLPLYQGKAAELWQKKVGLIGCGGLGGLCGLLLACAGVGHIHLADGDTVALHNLHRQLLFVSADQGSSKALKAESVLKAHADPAIEVKAFPEMITPDNFDRFASGLDLLLDVSDSASSRLVISRLCLERGIDLLSGAVSAYTALIALFPYSDPGQIEQQGCYRCLTSGFNINTKMGITGPIAAAASALTAHVALEWLLGERKLQGQLLRCDFSRMSMSVLRLCADPDCPDCRCHQAAAQAQTAAPAQAAARAQAAAQV